MLTIMKLLGAIGFLGLVLSFIFMLASWTTYVAESVKQRTWKPSFKPKDKKWFQTCLIMMVFFIVFDVLYVACTTLIPGL